MDNRKKSFAIAALRRASYRWPGRYKAAKRAHIGRNEYVCESCGCVVGRKEKQMDHRDPVIPTSGWEGFDSFIDRLLVDEGMWRTLCIPCHKEITAVQNEERKSIRHGKKNKIDEE